MEFDTDAWREELESYRTRKDDAFADGPQSPLPPERRDSFEGLEYFEPDPEFRVAATVEIVDGEETISMETTGGGEQLYERAVRLQFDLDGEEHTLVGYQRVDDGDGSLFVPFRDETTGEETYPAGRYMELHYEELEDGATVPVDFNLAYSPFCAYSDAYDCPLPPAENRLDAGIYAGERYEG